MVSVLIDNSTISAVQRLTGQITVGGAYDPEGDISAFEGFLTALLFYDDHYFIDDYKQEFRQQRAESFPYLTPISSEGRLFDRLQDASIEAARESMLSFRGVEVEANDVGKFLEQIGLHLSAAWVMRSSEFFLNLRILADQGDGNYPDKYKYSPLTSAIFHQVHGLAGVHDNRARLLSYTGKSVEEVIATEANMSGIDEQLKYFSANINWLTRRTVFYVFAANHFEFDFLLHPIRHGFLINYLGMQPTFSGPSIPAKIVQGLFQESKNTVASINEDLNDGTSVLDLPWHSTWLVGESGTPSAAIDQALALREKPELVTVREMMSQIRILQNQQKTAEAKRLANQMLAAAKRSLSSFAAKMGSAKTNTTSIASIGISLDGPTVSTLGAARDIAADYLSKRRVVGSFVRNVASDITGYQDLGRVRQRLRSEIRRDKEKYVPVLEADPPKFRLARSYWKKPL